MGQDLDFSEQDLKGADFSGAELEGGNFADADLQGADFCGADLYGTYLYRAKCAGCNFTGALLRGVVLDEADLSDADFSGARLLNNNMNTACSLLGADLRSANLANTILTGCEYSSTTSFPVGFDPASRGMVLAK